MSNIKTVLKRAVDDRVIINPLLTMQCNFECDHCFYSSGPSAPNLFMSDEILGDITRQIEDLNMFGIMPTLNLIGGEPTLNLKRFRHYLEWAVRLKESEMIGEIEMTTNGWWLKEVKWVRRFMEVIGETIPHYMYGMENGFSCRISNDPFHDPFHPSYIKTYGGDGLGTGLLEGIWDSYQDVYDEPVFYLIDGYECDDCNHWTDEEPEDNTCPECNDDPDYDNYFTPTYDSEVDFRIPPNPTEEDTEMPWLYIESYTKGTSTVIPTSRLGIGNNDVGSKYCANGVLSYRPTGILNDICCRGSDAPFGTTKYHPLVLLALAEKYIQEVRPSCFSCHDESREWAGNGPAHWKPIFQKELDRIERECEDRDIDLSDYVEDLAEVVY